MSKLKLVNENIEVPRTVTAASETYIRRAEVLSKKNEKPLSHLSLTIKGMEMELCFFQRTPRPFYSENFAAYGMSKAANGD
jgi:hypothetical protein